MCMCDSIPHLLIAKLHLAIIASSAQNDLIQARILLFWFRPAPCLEQHLYQILDF